MHAVVIGGTRFIGRHTVCALLADGYHVTIVNRGRHANPFADHPKVHHVRGDRNDRDSLERALDAAVPDLVIDCIALAPQQVATAIDVFPAETAYVLVSSTAAYARRDIPRREDETPLEPFTADHAVDDPASIEPGDFTYYGNRKAECDRVCFAAAEDGSRSFVVRPTFVYGPHDYTERFDYWIDRLVTHDRVLVPGDGDALAHHVYVEDVASAILTIATEGTPGEAYNVGARTLVTLDQRLGLVAATLDREVEFVHASRRELARFDLEPTAFPLVGSVPSLVDTAKLAGLGWDSTPHEAAVRATVEEHLRSDRTGRHLGPNRPLERRAIDGLTG